MRWLWVVPTLQNQALSGFLSDNELCMAVKMYPDRTSINSWNRWCKLGLIQWVWVHMRSIKTDLWSHYLGQNLTNQSPRADVAALGSTPICCRFKLGCTSNTGELKLKKKKNDNVPYNWSKGPSGCCPRACRIMSCWPASLSTCNLSVFQQHHCRELHGKELWE